MEFEAPRKVLESRGVPVYTITWYRSRRDGETGSANLRSPACQERQRWVAIDRTWGFSMASSSEPDREMDAARAGKPKPPPAEPPKDVRRRSLVIASFWLIVILVGLPVWWRTTTIYRATLPIAQMMEWADGKVQAPLSVYLHGLLLPLLCPC